MSQIKNIVKLLCWLSVIEPRSPPGGNAVDHFTSYDVTFIELRTITGQQLYNTLTTASTVCYMACIIVLDETSLPSYFSDSDVFIGLGPDFKDA